MPRSASLVRVKSNGELIVHPFGTFKGYGGYVGIYPYRLLKRDCSNADIGQAIIDALEHSKATGYPIGEIDRYREEVADAASEEIRARYFSDIKSASVAAKRFDHIDITSADRSAAITVCALHSDADQKRQRPAERIRVPIELGVEALGEAVRKLLD